jgi:hypothetical protein
MREVRAESRRGVRVCVRAIAKIAFGVLRGPDWQPIMETLMASNRKSLERVRMIFTARSAPTISPPCGRCRSLM